MAQSFDTTEETISGVSFNAIQSALLKFRSALPNLNIADYKISVMSAGNSIIVHFDDPEASPGQRGSGRKPGFEVELTKDAREIIRSNFVR
jgi:predicted aconitase